jgi:hypothetical protein
MLLVAMLLVAMLLVAMVLLVRPPSFFHCVCISQKGVWHLI